MNYYDILEIDSSANETEIKKAYRRLSLLHHPDRCGTNDKFQKINEAYECLSNSNKRNEYDTRQNGFGYHGNMNFEGIFPNNIHIIRMPSNMSHGFTNNMYGNMPGGLAGGIFNIINQEDVLMGLCESLLREEMNNLFESSENEYFYEKKNETKLQKDYEKKNEIKLQKDYEKKNEIIKVKYTVKDLYEKKMIECLDHYNRVYHIPYSEILKKGKIELEGVTFVFEQEKWIENGNIYFHKGNNIYIEKEISLKDALCGLDMIIKVFDKSYRIKTERGKVVNHEYKRCVKEKGLTLENVNGDLYIMFVVKYPSELTELQITNLEQIL